MSGAKYTVAIVWTEGHPPILSVSSGRLFVPSFKEARGPARLEQPMLPRPITFILYWLFV